MQSWWDSFRCCALGGKDGWNRIHANTLSGNIWIKCGLANSHTGFLLVAFSFRVSIAAPPPTTTTSAPTTTPQTTQPPTTTVVVTTHPPTEPATTTEADIMTSPSGCPKFPDPPNGQLFFGTLRNGLHTVRLTCDRGYFVAGSFSTYCVPNEGTWQDRLGLCQLEGTCLNIFLWPISEDLWTWKEYNTLFRIALELNLELKVSYSLPLFSNFSAAFPTTTEATTAPATTTRFAITDTITPTTASRTITPCARLPNPDNGRVISVRLTNGLRTARLACDRGFVEIGTVSMVCLPNVGQWPDTIGTCQRDGKWNCGALVLWKYSNLAWSSYT